MKKAWRNFQSVMKVAWSIDRWSIPLIISVEVIGGLKGYIGIFLSAWVLDSMASGVPFAQIIQPTLLCILLNFLANSLYDWLNMENIARRDANGNKFQALFTLKNFDMDYELLDSPVTTALRSRIESDQNFGNAFWGIYEQFGHTISGIIQVIAAIVVALPLFCRVPMCMLAIPAMLGISALSTWLDKKIGSGKRNKLLEEYEALEKNCSAHFLYNRSVDYQRGKDIRVYGAQEMIRSNVEGDQDAMNSWIRRFASAASMMEVLQSVPGSILQSGAYLCVVLGALVGGLSVGSVVKFSAALHNLVQQSYSLIFTCNRFVLHVSRQMSTLEYLDMPNKLYRGTLAVEKRDDNDFEVEFRNVSFKYPGSEKYALRNLNLKFNVGRRMAVVGRNGSGKTTMIKLLCRLYDPTEGEILLNGIDIRKYKYEEYQRLFAVVFQDFQLFSFPLGENVAAGIEYDPVLAESALRRAGFGERLDTLEKGLETALYQFYEEDGVEVSGGEAQKIALARALYKSENKDMPAPFIILDEPTAALDPLAEYDIYSRFNEIVRDRTAVYISHRLSSCRFCDDIIVFDEGSLVQRGSHAQLLKDENGLYSRMWNAQARYYQ